MWSSDQFVDQFRAHLTYSNLSDRLKLSDNQRRVHTTVDDTWGMRCSILDRKSVIIILDGLDTAVIDDIAPLREFSLRIGFRWQSYMQRTSMRHWSHRESVRNVYAK